MKCTATHAARVQELAQRIRRTASEARWYINARQNLQAMAYGPDCLTMQGQSLRMYAQLEYLALPRIAKPPTIHDL